MKWGNSYAVRLPKRLVEELSLNEEDELDLERKGETLLLKQQSKEAQLRALLKNIKPQQAIDWGAPHGKEEW